MTFLKNSKKEAVIFIAASSLGERWSDERYQSYIAQLPDSWYATLHTYRFWADKQRAVIGRLLLKKTLAHYHLLEESNEPIKLGLYGKPYFESGFKFSIAHSGDRIICAASPTVEVGIDIEQIRPIDFSDVEAVMSTRQWQQINSADNPVMEFWRLWTGKEALLKADGRGVGLSMATLSAESKGAYPDQKYWPITELPNWPGYCCHLSSSQLLSPYMICVTDYTFC